MVAEIANKTIRRGVASSVGPGLIFNIEIILKMATEYGFN